MNENSFLVRFIDERDNDDNHYGSIYDSGPLPCIGDVVDVWELRGGTANYPPEGTKPHRSIKGVVVRVEHTYEERGHNSMTSSWTHFVDIVLLTRKRAHK